MKPLWLLSFLLLAGIPEASLCASAPEYLIVPPASSKIKAEDHLTHKTSSTSILVSSDGPAFELEFTDVETSSGEGFDHPSLGEQRRQVAVAVFERIGLILKNEPGSARVRIGSSSPWLNQQTLAVGIPYFQCVDGFQKPIIHDALRNDVHVNDVEGELLVNFDLPLWTGPGTPPQGQYDLFTILFHEVIHVLGFVGFTVESDGRPQDCGGARMLPAIAAYARDDFGQALWTEDNGQVSFNGQSSDLPASGGAIKLDSSLGNAETLRLSSSNLRVSGHWIPEDFEHRPGVLMLREPFPTGEVRQNLTPETKAILSTVLEFETSSEVLGLTGSWIDPLLDGQGFSIQFLDQDRFAVYFFGFHDNGERFWAVGAYAGSVALGQTINLTMNTAEGGQFNHFSDATITESVWGNLELRFLDCHSAQATLSGEDGSQQMMLTTLARVQGLDCY